MAQSNIRRHGKKNSAAVVRNNLMDYIKMVLVVGAVTLAIVLFIKFRNGEDPVVAFSGQQVIKQNVFVNGIELAGKSYDEACETVQAAVDERLSTPIELWYRDSTWTITPKELDAKMLSVNETVGYAYNFGNSGSKAQKRSDIEYLKENPQRYETELQWNEEKLDAFVSGIKAEIDVPYTDARVVVDTMPVFDIRPSKDGSYIDALALKDQMEDALVAGGASRIELIPDVWHPEITTEMAQANTQLVSSFSTDSSSSNENRTKNIMRALKSFNGVTLQPGETVYFNQVVGKRTAANGFKEAPEFLNGNLQTGIGGGTCQASTTLYVALRRAGIQVDQRYPHSQLVAYIDPGLDATVTDNGIIKDLVFTNITELPFYIFTYVDYKTAKVEIYGTPPEYKIQLKGIRTKTLTADGYKKQPDKKARYVLSPEDPPVIVAGKEGKDGCVVEGWLYYYDRETGEEITEKREKLYTNTYYPVEPTMWVYYDGE